LSRERKPDAIVASNTPIAVGALLACHELGIVVPDDLRIATLGDSPWAQVVRPSLTSIPDTLPEFGQAAVQFLLDRILGRYDGPPRVETFPAQLLVRGSTAAKAPTEARAALPIVH